MNLLQALQDKHAGRLAEAIAALARRGYHSAYPEDPAYPLHAEGVTGSREAGEQAVRARWMGEAGAAGAKAIRGEERSAYGAPFGTAYADESVDEVLARAVAAATAWAALIPAARAAVALEILEALQGRAFEMAFACMHVCGQPFAMAFQAGTAHALDRALEAVAIAVREMAAYPARVLWKKPGPQRPAQVEKTFEVVPRGIAAVIGCATFPTWNSYPGLFASLVTGNPVVVKPHPSAVLPLALFVDTARDVLRRLDLPQDAVQLLVDARSAPKTQALALDERVKLIDFTGGPDFGDWLETHARQAHVFTEKAGVNAVIIESTADYPGMVRNLALTLSLYSGQMCTTPQSVYVPRGGIGVQAGESRTVENFKADLRAAIEKLVADPVRAVELLGAIQSDATEERIVRSASIGEPVFVSRRLVHPGMPGARLRTPAMYAVAPDAPGAFDTIAREYFGPISLLIATGDADEALRHARDVALARGAITWSVYSCDEAFVARAKRAAIDAGVHLTFDMTGPVLVNQSAAFSDLHVSGYNAAGNAALCDTAFVLPRFRVLQTRRYLPA